MTRILHIDASAREGDSLSRQLAAELVRAWRDAEPGATVTYRDLFRDPVSAVTPLWTTGAFEDPATLDDAQRAELVESESLVEQLFAHDVYVLGLPMYNFTVPAPFKAWIDQVVRPGRTVLVRDGRPWGALQGKRLFVLTASRYDYSPEGPLGHMNCLDGYLRVVFGFIGVTDVTIIRTIGVATPGAPGSMEGARAAIHAIVRRNGAGAHAEAIPGWERA
jgi:FMN-dependent NADH-azoreductase